MTLRVLRVGCGGFGAGWCSDFLPANMGDGRIEPVDSGLSPPHSPSFSARKSYALAPVIWLWR